MFRKVLVANRGEIACRVIRTLDRMGIASVAVFSDADAYAPHVLQASESVRIGTAPAADSYLRGERIIAAARGMGAEAVHPGYGFLSENPDFAEACAAAGIAFIGPTPEQMRAFGLKHRARELATVAGVPLAPGSGLLADVGEAKAAALRIGYPVMLKSSAGGGGIGLQLVRDEAAMDEQFARVRRLSGGAFGAGGIFLEKYVERGRHIEVQVFGDGRGRVVSLGERDCSVQRRNQKIIEETPAPGLSDVQRTKLSATAVRLCESVDYVSAGTVEFMQDADDGAFYFLEVNTRLQVEHGVTEEVRGIDLVEWMIRQAAGEVFDITPPAPRGHAIQARLYAEDPARGFRPSAGRLTRAEFPDSVRVETWVGDGTEVTPNYDPLLAKIVVTGADRDAAVTALQHALDATTLAGIETNLSYLRALTASPMFAAGAMTTRALETFVHRPRTIEVLSPGTQTTVQDYPGRLGYWCVGVPPSGPMDALSFRLANRCVGNRPDAAGLEMTVSGATLQFAAPMTICVAGAMSATLDGVAMQSLTPVDVAADGVLRVGAADTGARGYVAVRGGIDVPAYLGSRATFTLGKFGGHGGRALTTGDVLHVHEPPPDAPTPSCASAPVIGTEWELGVLYGPHGAPDFFTDDDIAAFFAATWKVHYNSSRTGVRLIGPKPAWARADGGEAGLHPSNIHDVAYAVGSVDFTGDMPVILGPDGPSLGGFVCPAVVVQAELWKLGQLRAGDAVRFRRMTPEQAARAEAAHERLIAGLPHAEPLAPFGAGPDAAIVGAAEAAGARPAVVYRRAGDKNLLVEYGPPILDIELRLRAHALMLHIQQAAPEGIIDLTPGIRSLQVHYDSRVLPLERLLTLLRATEDRLPAAEDMDIPSRIVRLPLSWDDAATQEAVARYMQSVRADAPWCPDNIEFIRRVNGLDSVDDVRRIVFEASYLVLGLGDVYLGAPVATPLDPRHRLVTTKYNPARTWTPENAVGIGGAYLCVYGMEGPGGYQLVGRTCQMWNTFGHSASFESDKPWLLRFFDQVQFYPVSNEELAAFRADLPHGRVAVDVTPATLSLRAHKKFLADNADGITQAKARQQAAFEAERARWALSAQSDYAEHPEAPDDIPDAVPPGCVAVASPVSGSVWRVLVAPGVRVGARDPLVLVESMKMELSVTAPDAGVVVELRCAEGRVVGAGQTLVVLRLGETA